MRATTGCLAGAAVAAAAMYLFDPRSGHYRRAVLRDRVMGRAVDPTAVAARVRACLGRVSSRPEAVRVTVEEGYVTLSGAVLAGEHADVVLAVANTHGVSAVDDRLVVCETGREISERWGGRMVHSMGDERPRESGSVVVRVLMGIAGAALAIGGLRGRGVLGLAVAGVGGALLLRSASSRPFVSARVRTAVGADEALQDSAAFDVPVVHPEQPHSRF